MTTETAPRRLNITMPKLFVGLRGVPRKALPTEILAGVTLAALMIPLNIGYAQVAGLPPVVGLYTAIVPSIMWAIFATSRNLVASPDAPIAALVGSLLGAIIAPTDPSYVELAAAQALVCALVFFLAWVFRLGALANFLSRAVLIGFITGLGIEVLLSQVEKIMGITVEAEGFFRELAELFTKITAANIFTIAVGVGTIVLIRLMKRYTPRLPGPLIALILMTVVVAVFNLDERGVTVLGDIPSGLPSLSFPALPLQDYLQLVIGAIAIVGVTMAEGLLVARQYAQKYDYEFDPDQEMFAFGAANVAAGMTGGFAVGSSASRTAAMDTSGAHSQIPSLVAAFTVAIVVLFFSDALGLLPNAVLAGIVANSVVALIEVFELRQLFNWRRSEFWIAIVCMLSVLVFGALQAVVIAFVLSTIDVVRRASNPHTAVLGEDKSSVPVAPEATSSSPKGTSSSPDVTSPSTLPGLIDFRFGSSLFFANANYFETTIKDLVENSAVPVEWFVLDAEAISDIDTTGAEVLEGILAYFEKRNITFALARVHEPIPELLERYGLMEHIDPARFYATNRAAITAFAQETGRPLPDLDALLSEEVSLDSAA